MPVVGARRKVTANVLIGAQLWLFGVRPVRQQRAPRERAFGRA